MTDFQRRKKSTEYLVILFCRWRNWNSEKGASSLQWYNQLSAEKAETWVSPLPAQFLLNTPMTHFIAFTDLSEDQNCFSLKICFCINFRKSIMLHNVLHLVLKNGNIFVCYVFSYYMEINTNIQFLFPLLISFSFFFPPSQKPSAACFPGQNSHAKKKKS